MKTHGPSKSSLVWTLRSSDAPRNGDGNLQNHKIVPRLFPWKRPYWKTVKPNTCTHKNSSSSIVRHVAHELFQFLFLLVSFPTKGCCLAEQVVIPMFFHQKIDVVEEQEHSLQKIKTWIFTSKIQGTKYGQI